MQINRLFPAPRKAPISASSHQAARAAGQLKLRYRMGMGMILLLTLLTQTIVQIRVMDQADIARLMTVADEQRMLCQRLSSAAFVLERLARKGEPVNSASRARCAAELRLVTALWKQSQTTLLSLNRPRDASGQLSPLMRRLLALINAPRQNMMDTARDLLAGNARPGLLDTRRCAAGGQTMQAQSPAFMKGLGEYVQQYEGEARASNERLELFANNMLIVLLLVLLLLGAFVFRPALARVRQSVEALLNAQTCIEQQNDELRANNALLEAQQAELEAQQDELTAQQDELEHQARELERHNGELRLLNELLEQRATTDGLTGLKNHSAFRRELEQMAERAVHTHSPLSIILLDVDHFKQYNDTYGHPGGDEVLKQVARLLQDGSRAADVAARYGGEEFIVLLPETDAAAAGKVAEGLRHALAAYAWPARPVTASFGVASLAPHTSERAEAGRLSGLSGLPDISELIDRADRALYHSKRQGRNRVSHAEQQEEQEMRIAA